MKHLILAALNFGVFACGTNTMCLKKRPSFETVLLEIIRIDLMVFDINIQKTLGVCMFQFSCTFACYQLFVFQTGHQI